jgi:hypothetical protein
MRVATLLLPVILVVEAFGSCTGPIFSVRVLRDGELISNTTFAHFAQPPGGYIIEMLPGDEVLAQYTFGGGNSCGGSVQWYTGVYETLIQHVNSVSTAQMTFFEPGVYSVFGQGFVSFGFSFRVEWGVLTSELALGLLDVPQRPVANEVLVSEASTVLRGTVVGSSLLVASSALEPSTLPWRIIAANGTVMAEGNAALPAGMSEWTVDLASMAPGLYLFDCGSGASTALRFVKE